MLTAAGAAQPVAGEARVDAVAGADERLVGHAGWRSGSRARARARRRARPRRAAGRARPAAGWPRVTSPASTQPADVARGDDLAVDLEQRVHDRLEAPVGGEQLRVALGACGRSGSSRRPTTCLAPSAPTSTSSMNSSRRARGEVARRRGSRSAPATPSAAISSALRSSVVSSFGVCWGATTDTGCGSNVSTLSAPRDHLAVAEVHAVEGADGDAARASALDVGQAGDLHGRTKPIAARRARAGVARGRSLRARSAGGIAPGLPARRRRARRRATSNGPIAVRRSSRQ